MKYLTLLLFLLLTTCGSEEPEQATRPNILFAIADDASFPHMGAYGTSWVTTPAFDRVAREGLLFNRAYTPNAKCAPSRSCILTGRNSWQLEEAANHSPAFPVRFTSFVEVLGENGYRTGFTGKGWGPGDPGAIAGQRRELTGKAYSDIATTPPTSKISSIDYAANFSLFLDEKPAKEPFFFWYGGYEPHRAYEYGTGLTKSARKLEDITEVPPMWPDNDSIRTDMLDYALEIDYFDSHLGEMMAELERRGELDNTIIVVTADNGMPFPRIKGQEYELSNHLPLAIRWPEGIEESGRKIEDFVSFIDFAPTFLEAAGVAWEESKMKPTVGKSLLPVFANESQEPFREYVVFGKERHDVGRPDDQGYPIRGIVSGDMIYINNYEPSRWPVGNPEAGYLNTDGSPTKTVILNKRRKGIDDSNYWQLNFGKRPPEEVYNIKTDPYCVKNLVDDPNLSTEVAGLREQLMTELREQRDPRAFGNGAVFEGYPYHGKVADFYNRLLKDPSVKQETGWIELTDYEDGPIEE